MTSESKISETDIWAVIEEAFPDFPDRPPNSITAPEYAARKRVSTSRAHVVLKEMAAAKKLRMVKCRGTGGRPVVAYVPA